MTEFQIAGRAIGYDYPPLVVAEIGINHEGNLDTAIEMVDAAWESGAEMIKHQTHVIDDEMSREAREIVPGNSDVSIYEVMARCALSEADEWRLMAHVQSRGMIFISTPFSRAAADRLQAWNVPAFKIGSGECNNYPLLRHVAAFGKPVILSTGMNDMPVIRKAVQILRSAQVPYALLHCINLYPTPMELVHLGGITQLLENFPDAVVGYSDHTVSNLACLGAVALGASILERHFTDRTDRPGPDIACSMDPVQLRDLIDQSRELAKARGGDKRPLAEEEVTRRFAFASVVTTRAIARGERFDATNLWVKRPGTGDFAAADYELVLGKAASRDLPANVQLKRSDVQQ